MAEEKLTVAELLARAGKENKRSSKPRRRHRSAEEGGISVAELTGSLPAVDAKPKTSRHSEPIDAPAEAIAAHEEASRSQAHILNEAQAAAAKASASPHEAHAPGMPAVAQAAEPEGDSKADARSAQQHGHHEALGPSGFDVQVVSENDMGPLTTGTIPVVTDEHIATANETAATRHEKTKDAQTQPATLVDEEPIPVAAPTPSERTAAYPAAPSPADDKTVELEKTLEDEVEATTAEAPEPEKASMVAIVLLSILAIAIGVAVFNGFELLWSHVNHGITLALAILITLGIVGCVHALRSEKDKVSMFLAALAGLAVTFGPLAIVGL